jgi:hypothetical protein
MKKNLYLILAGGLLLQSCADEKSVVTIRDIETNIYSEGLFVQEDSTVDRSKFTVGCNYIFTNLTAHNWSFVNKAFAMSPADPSFKSLEKVTDIRIYTVQQYNNHYIAGSDISDSCLFNLYNQGYYESYQQDRGHLRKAEILKKMQEASDDFTQQAVMGFGATPQTLPDAGSRQQLVIEVRTNKGTMVRDTSITFKIR